MTIRKLIVRTLQTTRLNKISHRIYYSYIHGFNTAHEAVLPALTRALEEAARRRTANDGDYYEFGVFKGYAFWHAQSEAERLGLGSMRFFGFDSFAGLPEVQGVDATPRNDFYRGQYACSKEKVVQNLNQHGVDWNRTTLVEGYFEQTLNDALRRQYRMRPVAVALLDCDLYSSTNCALRFLSPLIQAGSVLLMDDWNCFDGADDRGQRRALREFALAHPQWRLTELFPYGDWGQAFLVHATEDA